MEESSEFRSVHAARECLEVYNASGKNLDVLRNIKLDHIKRYDVWMCVFEKESKAYAVLQEKEIYNMLMEYHGVDTVPDKLTATLCVCILDKMIEFKSPLSVERALKAMLDIMGDEFLPVLEAEVQKSIDRRREIISRYTKKDNEWVGYMIKLQEIILAYSK